MDYQFTFNLSRKADKHLTAINFKSQPTKSDVDVSFAVKCIHRGGQSTNAKVPNFVKLIKFCNSSYILDKMILQKWIFSLIHSYSSSI